MDLIRQTLTVFCADLARSHELRPATGQDADFILRQLDNMPAVFSFPLRLATTAFALSGLLRGGAPFHRLGVNQRDALLGLWRDAPVGPCRDLIRFLSSLALLSLYSRPGAWELPQP